MILFHSQGITEEFITALFYFYRSMGELKVTETEYALLVATTVLFSGRRFSRCPAPPQAAAGAQWPRCASRPRRPPAAEEQAARGRAAGAVPGHPLQVLEDPPPRGPAAFRPPHRAADAATHP